MNNKYSGGARKERFYKKLISKSHRYSGLVHWNTVPTRIKPSQRFQTSPKGDSTSCVAQSKASHIETVTKIVVSATPIFQNRKPKGQGMSLSNADSNTYSIGTNTETLIPSEKMTDTEMDVSYTSPTPIKATGEGIFVNIDADEIADAISHFKGVSVTFGSNEQEWDAPNQTPVYKGTPITFYHCIFFYDFYINNGVKTFEASDSDGLWSSPTGIRHITEEFLMKRSTGASYNPGYLDMSLINTPPTPLTTAQKLAITLGLQGLLDALKAFLKR